MIALEALQALDSIDRKGSFAAAAEELYRVPSAITYTVKKAEEQLKITLFDRTQQRAKLTPAGKVVLAKGRDILLRMQQLEEQALQAETGWENQLRVVIDTIIPCEPFWPLFHSLQEQQPWLDIRVMAESLSGSWEALVNDRADLIIGVSGDEPIAGQWQSVSLGHLQSRLCCSPNHPASRMSDSTNDDLISLESLKDFTQIVISDSARHLAQRNVGLLGIQQTLAVQNLEQKVSALIHCMGVSHLPAYLAEPLAKQGKLSILRTQKANAATPSYMFWRKDNTGKANQWLRKQIIEQNVLANHLS